MRTSGLNKDKYDLFLSCLHCSKIPSAFTAHAHLTTFPNAVFQTARICAKAVAARIGPFGGLSPKTHLVGPRTCALRLCGMRERERERKRRPSACTRFRVYVNKPSANGRNPAVNKPCKRSWSCLLDVHSSMERALATSCAYSLSVQNLMFLGSNHFKIYYFQ